MDMSGRVFLSSIFRNWRAFGVLLGPQRSYLWVQVVLCLGMQGASQASPVSLPVQMRRLSYIDLSLAVALELGLP